MNKKYIHYFDTEQEFNAKYNGDDYYEPWVSCVKDSNISYNKNEYETLLTTPLTFEITGGGKLYWRLNKADGVAKTIDYKKNDGDWVTITSTTSGIEINVTTGDIIQFRGDNEVYSNGDWFNSFDPTTENTNNAAVYVAKGNIMSLINKTNFPTIFELGNNALRNMFIRTKITDARDLLLPARKVGEQCYTVMFKQCDILNTAPSILPATTLANNCYNGMFQNCTHLTTAPKLPATTLTYQCYVSMFSDCTSLTTAPELPATILINECYRSMFNRCSRLNYIKCLATDISASNCIYLWTSGVPSTGTFVKNPSMTSWPTGISGIPSGWTIQDAS